MRRNALHPRPDAAPSRRHMVWGTVTEEELARVKEAYTQAGFSTVSQAGRVLSLAFAESAEVRDTVSRWFRSNVERVA